MPFLVHHSLIEQKRTLITDSLLNVQFWVIIFIGLNLSIHFISRLALLNFYDLLNTSRCGGSYYSNSEKKMQGVMLNLL